MVGNNNMIFNQTIEDFLCQENAHDIERNL